MKKRNGNHYHGIVNGYRSGLEKEVAAQLNKSGHSYAYEPKDGKIAYVKPETNHKYTPDFTFAGSSIIIETKGRFMTEDRKKHLLIKQQHPEYDIRFVFSNSKGKIRKGSKTTYADWCNKHGFKWADKLIPKDWLKEIK